MSGATRPSDRRGCSMNQDWVQSAIVRRMPTHLHVRDVPDDLHRSLISRAKSQGLSLRQYVLQALADHEALPTLDEWLDGLARMPPAAPETSGAEAVRASREADDEKVLAAVTGR